LALVCLLSVGASGASPGLSASQSAVVAVYLVHPGNTAAPVLDAMQKETHALLLAEGLHVTWVDAGKRREVASQFLVVVDLEGSCRPQVDSTTAVRSPTRLATTATSNGVILPFSNLHCSALSQFLAPAMAREPRTHRDALFGRAMGRLVAHELCHYLRQTRGHGSGGVSQAALSVRELISDHLGLDEDDPADVQLASR
jgi:hypothetical protein